MLKIGIVGLPNVGKSTLFNALTKASVPAENYPFCTIDPSVGVVGVPDERLDKLAELSKSEKTIPAAVEFVDIAGLVKGASEGEGLGNQFLSHIRETDAILQMVRFFDDVDITHVHGEVDPVRDIEVINLELILADQQAVAGRRERLAGDVRAQKKDAVAEDAVLVKVEHELTKGSLARVAGLTEDEAKLIKSLNLLTLKPILYCFNGKTGGHNLDEVNDGRAKAAFDYVESLGGRYVQVDARTEHELNDVAQDDKEMFRSELGVQVDGLESLIRGAYATLGLITFFTTGPKESRAWTVKQGGLAPDAGAAIHNDFKDKFIRAEVIGWDTLLQDGSWSAARDKGDIRTEGKTYLVKDGDVMVFCIASARLMKASHATEVRTFEDIPNIGPRIAAGFVQLGIRTPQGLAGKEPFALYTKLCQLTGVRQDPCVLDTFMAAVDFMEGASARPWWDYTAERKKEFPIL